MISRAKGKNGERKGRDRKGEKRTGEERKVEEMLYSIALSTPISNLDSLVPDKPQCS